MLLAQWLDQAGMSNQEFADRLDVHAVTVSNWSRGRTMPQPRKVVRIERLTGGMVRYADLWFAHRSYHAARTGEPPPDLDAAAAQV